MIYHSLTGNKTVVARTIAEVLGIEPLNVRGATPEAIEEVFLLSVGNGVYTLRPSSVMVRHLQARQCLANYARSRGMVA